MLFAYVDESSRDEDYYFLSAVVCSEPQVTFLERQLDGVLMKHSKTFDSLGPWTELHGSEMMRARSQPWRSIPLRARIAIYSDAMRVVAASRARIFIEGINIPAQKARGYPVLTPARELAFSHLLEQINRCCHKQEPRIRVIADEHHTAEQSRSNFTRYQQYGTYGYRSSKLQNIEPRIEFAPSDRLRGLQAADLVTYIYNRWLTVTDADPRARRAAEQLWTTVQLQAIWPTGRHRVWPNL